MKAVSALIGLDFIADETITLLKLLENGAFEMVNEIVDISSNATQEQQIERALNEMGTNGTQPALSSYIRSILSLRVQCWPRSFLHKI